MWSDLEVDRTSQGQELAGNEQFGIIVGAGDLTLLYSAAGSARTQPARLSNHNLLFN
jgi:hypothetical protein